MSDLFDPDPTRVPDSRGIFTAWCPLCGIKVCMQADSEWLLDQGVAAHDAVVHGLSM